MVLKKTAATLSLVLGLVGLASVGAQGADGVAHADGEVVAQALPVDYSTHAYVEVEAWTLADAQTLDRLGTNLSCRLGPGVQPMIIDRARLVELGALGLVHRVVEPNVQQVLDAHRRANDTARAQRDATFYTAYRTRAEISDLIDLLVATNPAIATRVSIGTSLEGRDIFGIVIKGVNAPVDAPRFVINGCQHAREWVSPMSVCYTAEQLVTLYGSDQQVTDLVDAVEFHIIPIVNPDGYLHTWSSERFWRKNRRDNGDGTTGVDLNRNWSFAWGGVGSSGSTSNDLYRGPSPFSEPETTALSNYMAGLAGSPLCQVGVDCGDGDECTHVKAHLDIHTHGALILGPWGWTDTQAPPRESELRGAQDAMAAAIQSVNGLSYTAGLGIDQLLYVADGICPDWAFGVLGALAWTYELRPAGSQGLAGFDPPPGQIILGTTEAFAGILVLADRISITGLIVEAVDVPSVLIVGEGGGLVSATALPSGDCDLSVTGVELLWREQGAGSFTSIPMVDNAGVYEALLPEPECGTTLEYYVQANGSGGETETNPADAPTGFLTAEAIEIVVSLDDDFETDAGWTVGAGDDTATTGVWNRMDPEATDLGSQPEDDSSPDGTLCWVTDGNAGASAGNFDVDGGKTTLTTPVFDLSASSAPVVSFDLWYSNSTGASPNGDTFRIDVTDDGSTWVNAITVGPSGAETNGGWAPYEFAIDSFVGLTSSVQVRFVAEDALGGSIVEAAIDEFKILESVPCVIVPPMSCVGDLDGDGDTDVLDFSVFGGNFGSSVPVGTGGDYDDDGDVDVLDFATFAGDFGCQPAP